MSYNYHNVTSSNNKVNNKILSEDIATFHAMSIPFFNAGTKFHYKRSVQQSTINQCGIPLVSFFTISVQNVSNILLR